VGSLLKQVGWGILVGENQGAGLRNHRNIESKAFPHRGVPSDSKIRSVHVGRYANTIRWVNIILCNKIRYGWKLYVTRELVEYQAPRISPIRNTQAKSAYRTAMSGILGEFLVS